MNTLPPALADMVRLAARVASNCPGDGDCLIQRLQDQNIDAEQIAQVVQIARETRARSHDITDERTDMRMKQLFGFAPGQSVSGADCCGGSACCN